MDSVGAVTLAPRPSDPRPEPTWVGGGQPDTLRCVLKVTFHTHVEASLENTQVFIPLIR